MADSWATEAWKKSKGSTECNGESWHAQDSEEKRHRILRCLVQRKGYADVIKKMNFLSNATSDEGTSKVARSDIEWLKKEFGESKKYKI